MKKIFPLLLITLLSFYLSSVHAPQSSLMRLPASANDSCMEVLAHFFPEAHQDQQFSSKLHPIKKTHPSGKTYIELTADNDFILNDPAYTKFLEETLEIIYFPSKSFGHVKLRIGKVMYDFKGVKFAGIDKYVPKMKKNKNASEGPMGFVFK